LKFTPTNFVKLIGREVYDGILYEKNFEQPKEWQQYQTLIVMQLLFEEIQHR